MVKFNENSLFLHKCLLWVLSTFISISVLSSPTFAQQVSKPGIYIIELNRDQESEKIRKGLTPFRAYKDGNQLVVTGYLSGKPGSHQNNGGNKSFSASRFDINFLPFSSLPDEQQKSVLSDIDEYFGFIESRMGIVNQQISFDEITSGRNYRARVGYAEMQVGFSGLKSSVFAIKENQTEIAKRDFISGCENIFKGANSLNNSGITIGDPVNLVVGLLASLNPVIKK